MRGSTSGKKQDTDDDQYLPLEVVYGTSLSSPPGLVFISKVKALELAATLKAVFSSSTWGELRSKVEPTVFRKLLVWCFDEDTSFEHFLGGLEKKTPRVNEETARLLYRDLDIGERWPEDHDSFEPYDIRGLADGDWPDWPEQLMLRCVPREILAEYSRREDSALNGPFAVLDETREKEIVADLETYGCRCTRDDELVRACSGG